MTSEETSADELLQAGLDRGEALPDEPDARAYQRVYQALAHSKARLPTNFAYGVRQQLVRQRLAVGTGAASLLPVLVAGVALLGGYALMMVMTLFGYGADIRPPGVQMLRGLSPVWGYAALVVCLLLALDGFFVRWRSGN